MNNKLYQIFNIADVLKNDKVIQEVKDSLSWIREPEYITGVFECYEGIPIHLIGIDGGEPEDQTLYRDWNWVVEALNNAYQEGYDNGYEKGREFADSWSEE